MRSTYEVHLGEEERRSLYKITRKGKAAAYKIRHANILLKADKEGPAWSDTQIAEAFGVHVNTVWAIRRRYVEQGRDAAVNRKQRENPAHEPIFDGEKEARLIALSCSQPPEGRTRWTLHLLADKVVELKVVDRVSHETVRKVLKKTSLSRTCANRG